MKPEGLVPEECLVFADDTNQNSIDIYIGENRPDIGINTYPLSDYQSIQLI